MHSKGIYQLPNARFRLTHATPAEKVRRELGLTKGLLSVNWRGMPSEALLIGPRTRGPARGVSLLTGVKLHVGRSARWKEVP